MTIDGIHSQALGCHFYGTTRPWGNVAAGWPLAAKPGPEIPPPHETAWSFPWVHEVRLLGISTYKVMPHSWLSWCK
jgi:hypothetical protein